MLTSELAEKIKFVSERCAVEGDVDAGTVAQLAESYLELLEIIDEMNPCPPGECLHPSCQRAAKALIDSGVREWNERPPNTAN